MSKVYRKIQELDLRNRRVFVRLDLNVPLKKGDAGGELEVSDATRIEGALETVRYIVQQGGKCLLASHLGRPGGHPTKKYSLEPVGKKISELLNRDIILTEDCVGDGPRSLSQQMRAGEVLLLENLRFHPGEEDDSIEFANKLAELCDVYVTDAFGTAHRAHASTHALPSIMADKGMGFLMQKELRYLEPLKEAPQRPFVLIMGGSKVSDKIGVLEHFLDKVDHVLIGGAMAYAFLKASGTEIAQSYCEDKQVALAVRLLKSASARNVKMVLPVDHVVAQSLTDTAHAKTTTSAEVPAGFMGVDVGPKTLQAFSKAIETAETIFWNGPMGVFEEPAFAKGTFDLARLIASAKGKKMAGGGDVVAAISQSGHESKFDFISTGGGATLEYLEGKDLPGLKILELPNKPS